MVFWIFIGLIALAWAVAIVTSVSGHRRFSYYFGEASAAATIATVVIVIVGFFVIFPGASGSAEREPVMTGEYGLRALVTKEATETHAAATFFLGFGYAESNTVEVSTISYIATADDGGNTIHKVGIEDSVIYEGSATPYVEYWQTRTTTNDWWWPWPVVSVNGPTTYRFHIPEGSIYEGYEVTP